MLIDAILILMLSATILFRNLLLLVMLAVSNKLVRKTFLQTGFLFMQLPNMTEVLHQLLLVQKLLLVLALFTTKRLIKVT